MPKSLSKKKKSSKKSYIFLKIAILVLCVTFVSGITTVTSILFPSSDPDSECANSISCVENLTGVFEEDQQTGIFMNQAVNIPRSVAQNNYMKPVLGHSTASKQIYVDLSSQRLYAYEDNKLVFDFPVSTGKWGTTPTGTFNVWVKLRYTRMSGGSKEAGTYYNLPNVPYTMFFYNKNVPKSMGYGIHGAYWHNNFGHPMSHGCINMKPEDAGKLYEWATPPADSSITYATIENPGTQIIIYGETPIE